jgi:phosphoribosylformylglycinamidine synthase
MADRGGTGVRMHLDRVPQREEGMNPYEIMLSESQERMLIIVEAGREHEVISIFQRWELDAVAIGEVVEGGAVELYWHGELVSSVPAHLLTSAVPEYTWPEKAPTDPKRLAPIDLATLTPPADLAAMWLEMIASPNLCSRHDVYNQYDSTVRGNTVVHPGGDSGVIRLKGKAGSSDTEKGIAITLDCNSRYCAIDARTGTGHSLAEACRNLAAVGAEPIGISDCLNMPSPEQPETMWQIAESIRGLGEAARAFDVPVVSGNVSLYNQTHGQGILPTPTLAVVGLLPDASVAIGSGFKTSGDIVLLLGATNEAELGGSEYLAARYALEQGALPALNYALEQRTADCVRTLVRSRLLVSCHDLAQGGLASALAECCFRDYEAPIGVTLTPEGPVTRADAFLFSESGARFLVSVKPEHLPEVIKALEHLKIPVTAKGTVGGSVISVSGVAKIPVLDAFHRWWHGLDSLFEG